MKKINAQDSISIKDIKHGMNVSSSNSFLL